MLLYSVDFLPTIYEHVVYRKHLLLVIVSIAVNEKFEMFTFSKINGQ